MRHLSQIFSACLALLLFYGPATAQTYPDYTEIYVNDFADVIENDLEADIRTRLEELRDKRDIEFTVVTIHSMTDFGHEGAIEPFATGLFNYWGVGDAERNDGVMMLVAVSDRHMRIEVGSGYSKHKDLALKELLESVILPKFRDGNFGEGIAQGVTSVIYELTGSYPGEYDATAPQKAFNAIQRFIDWLGAWIWAISAPFVALFARLYFRWKRNRPRKCPKDGAMMVRLDEDWDDNHLQSGQITEEQLKSVDYDVWQCPKCDHIKVEAYKSWISFYGACRKCGFRTVEGETTVLQNATKSSSGLKRIDYHCHHCGDEYSVERTIPRISESSSSSSGSFGGGSSSGGGASGSW